MDIHSLERAALAVAAMLAFAIVAPGNAEEGPFASATSASALSGPSQAELDQLLAPVALYPDDLLTQVLTASTYPLEVVQLRRWLDANPGLTGAALGDALAAQPWDESVKALAAFPAVVAMMDGQLEWTQRLGDAFLASPADVMDTVQQLRRRASGAGNLQDNERERVIVEQDVIRIEPAAPDVIYVPVYDPWTVYGPWWWPGYPPYAWSVTYFGPWDYWVGGLYFGAGFYVGGWWHDHHTHPDWHGHQVHWTHPGSHDTWRHDSGHRGGVPYVHPFTRDRYGAGRVPPPADRQPFRGFDVQPRTPGSSPPGTHPYAAPRAPSSSSRPSAPGAPSAHPFSPPAHPFSPPAQAFSRSAPSSSPIGPAAGSAQQSARGHASLGGGAPYRGGGTSTPHASPAPHGSSAPHASPAPSSHPGSRSR